MDLLTTLKNIGLSEKEAKVYLVLLEFHEATPSVISRRAGIKRPTAYVILEQLQAKGLVSKVKRKNILSYQPLPPQALAEDHLNRYHSLKQALPELLALNQKYISTPQMSVFEGRQGMIRIMEDTLTASGELFCWADIAEAVNSLQDYYPTYISKKVKNRLWLRGILCYNSSALRFKKFGNQELREVYLVPREKFPFRNEINIYDDKVAIISHADQIGVIIQNKNIADTQRSIFLMGFEYAKILEPQILTAKDQEYLKQKIPYDLKASLAA